MSQRGEGSEVQREMVGSQLGVANFWQILKSNREPFPVQQLLQVSKSFLIGLVGVPKKN